MGIKNKNEKISYTMKSLLKAALNVESQPMFKVLDKVESKDIIMGGDGNAQRAFFYIVDVIGNFFKVLLKAENYLTHTIGNNKEVTSIRDLAKTLSSIPPERNASLIQKLNIDNNYLKNSIDKAIPDICRIKDLGWNLTTNLKDVLKRTIESFFVLNSYD